MNDHDALLRAIVENPAEDTPRLVFADWLDENADTFPTPAVARLRAAFIRDDIAMSQRDEFDPLRLRWELIEKPRREAEAWVKETVPQLSDGYEFVGEPRFRRGLLWAVEIRPLGYVGKHVPLPAILPVQCVRFRDSGYSAVTILHNSEWRTRINEIAFHPGTTGRMGVRRLVQVPGLDRLVHLTFGDPSLGRPPAIEQKEVQELLESPLFGQLTSLTICRAPVGTTVVERLARRVEAGPLRELHLNACQLRPESLASLLDSPTGNQLQSLAVGGDMTGKPGKLFALSCSVSSVSIKSLDMTLDTINEADLEAAISSPLVRSLRRLSLVHCSLNRDRARLLAQGAFATLRILALSHNRIGNDGAVAIARSPHLVGLRVLDLSYSQVGDEGIEAILDSPLAENLVLLELHGSPASAEMKEVLKAKMGDRVRVKKQNKQ